MSSPEDHLRAFLESLGFDLDGDPHLKRTPQRVSEMFAELFSAHQVPAPSMSVFDAPPGSGLVLATALPFRSMCVHHLVPFFGTIDIAYLPGERMCGFGSFGRVIEWASRRPQIQEELVAQIAEVLDEQIAPRGLLVRCRARQMCVEMRGGRQGTYVSLHATGALAAGGDHYAAALGQMGEAENEL